MTTRLPPGKEKKKMTQMIQYQNGETRVIDTESMTASEFLHSGELAFRMADYNLDCTLELSDLEPTYTVLRDEHGDYGTAAQFARVKD